MSSSRGPRLQIPGAPMRGVLGLHHYAILLPARAGLGRFLRHLGVHLARWARERLEPVSLALTSRGLPMGQEITPESLGEVSGWLTERLDTRVSA